MLFVNYSLDIKQSQHNLTEAFRLGLGFKEYLNFHKKHILAKRMDDEHFKRQLTEEKNSEIYFEQD